MEQELVGIQIQIAGKSYPMKVPVTESEMIKSVAESINDKINTLQKTYPRQDKDDYLSMAFLTFAIDANKQVSLNPTPSAPIQNIEKAIPEPTPPAAPSGVNISDELLEKIINLDSFLDSILENQAA
jgi:cell division protein ZapA (FtsZ GTPase activity inhibitor)